MSSYIVSLLRFLSAHFGSFHSVSYYLGPINVFPGTYPFACLTAPSHYPKQCYLFIKVIMWHLLWWRHQMEKNSRVTGPLYGDSPVTAEFPAQRPVTRSFGIFFDLRLNKPLSEHSWDWWFETPSCPLWRHCNAREQFHKKCSWSYYVTCL